MKTLVLVFAAVALWVVVGPAYAQQPSVELPKDGNGMLDYCSHLAESLDSPSSQLSPAGDRLTASEIEYSHNMYKQGWCGGCPAFS